MSLPDSYTLKPGAIPAYFDALLDAQPPERFSVKFIENLGFTSTNDRLFIGILKDLGFLNRDGAPQTRYYEFLDRSRSKQVLAQGIREAFADLFAVNIKANDLSNDEIKNKLRTLYSGQKTDLVIGNIAKTFKALCEYADFGAQTSAPAAKESAKEQPPAGAQEKASKPTTPLATPPAPPVQEKAVSGLGKIAVSGLQYHINIVLPDSRDQAVYDAIFKSLREHLG